MCARNTYKYMVVCITLSWLIARTYNSTITNENMYDDDDSTVF